MPIPVNPIVVIDDTTAPKFIAAATGVVFVPADSGGAEGVLTAGQEVNALELIVEGGVLTGEALSSAAAQTFPLGTSTEGGAPRFVDSPLGGDQIGSVEGSESLGVGTTPVVPDTTVPNAYETFGPVIEMDPQNPVVVASSALESTIPNTPLTRANLTAGQNAPIAGTGGTPRSLGRTIVVPEPGVRAAIL